MTRGRTTKEHVAGKPVHASTYQYHGCRCDDCTAASTAAVRTQRHARNRALLRVQSRAQSKAVAHVRATSPALWERFMTEAYEELGIERRPRGRSRGTQPIPDSPE